MDHVDICNTSIRLESALTGRIVPTDTSAISGIHVLFHSTVPTRISSHDQLLQVGML